MKAWLQFACSVTLGMLPVASFAGELAGVGVASAHAQHTALAAIQVRPQLRGLRLREIRWDAVLKQSWAVFEDVEHPERPLWAERTDAADPAEGLTGSSAGPPVAAGVVGPSQPPVAVVRYGDRVRLWRIEQNVRIEMSAVAEGSAGVGEDVKVRIPGSGINGETGWRVTGIVHGPGDVEMEQ